MRALGFEPKKEEIKKMIADIDKVRSRCRGTLRLLARVAGWPGRNGRRPCSGKNLFAHFPAR